VKSIKNAAFGIKDGVFECSNKILQVGAMFCDLA